MKNSIVRARKRSVKVKVAPNSCRYEYSSSARRGAAATTRLSALAAAGVVETVLWGRSH